MTLDVETGKQCVKYDDCCYEKMESGQVTYLRIGTTEGNRTFGPSRYFGKSNLWVRLVPTVAY